MSNLLQPRRQTDAARSLIVAGFLEAIIVAYCCPPPELATLTWRILFWTALKYVVFSTLAAGVGAWTFHNLRRSSSPLNYSVLVLLGGPCWTLMAPIALLYQQNSLWVLLIVAIASVLAALCLRDLLPASRISYSEISDRQSVSLFSQPAYSGPSPWRAFFLSAGLYGAGAALLSGHLFAANLLLAACVFVIAWQFLSNYSHTLDMARSKWRLAVVVVFAWLLTCVSLLPWLRHSPIEQAANAAASRKSRSVSAAEKQARGHDAAPGYQGIILWTVPLKKDALPPVPHNALQAGWKARQTEPLVIPFDGAYWYFQEPHHSPGPKAHVAHGDPLAVNIRSTNWFPLVMEAHQSLATPIDLSCCSEVRVAIRNQDNRPGGMNLAVVLSDSLSPGKPTLYLGQQPVLSRQPVHTSPEDVVLTFAVPPRASIHQFDQITVLVLPSSEWSETGPKISIQQFVLVPR